ncbi:MAG TPA: membrane protein insertase YidC [Oligoflexus sp.]|uniref:membrane protein insertase YidC n=1 Tax=Oligoflexus sp. TaxID=1971216 RepID=UPI002D598EBD|nr:membrane protein insertase YidC [Oligoflexus sp.]HYX39289.1 membrane protein insertase YidC [Oligoflexus sp.]
MNWDKKSIVAVFICTLLFMGYMTYLQSKYPDFYAGNRGETVEEPTPAPTPTTPNPAPAAAASAPPADAAAPGAATLAPAQVTSLTAQELTFDTKTRIIRFDQSLGGIASIQLKDYAQDQKSGYQVEVLDSPILVQGTTNIQDKLGQKGFAGQREGNTIRFSRTENNWAIEQIFTVPEDGYGLQVKVNFKNNAAVPQELTGGALVQENIAQPPSSGGFLSSMFGGNPASATTFVYSVNGKTNEMLVHDLCKEDADPTAFNLTGEKLDYIGIDRHYFLSFLWAKDQPMNYLLQRSSEANALFCPTTILAWQKFGLVEAGGTVSVDLSGYFGPKQRDILAAHDPALASSIKLGWFSFFAHPLMIVLKELHKLLHNWGLAIIVITVLLKLLFYPLTKAAAVSMKKMQKLQPEMTAIREKFKDDPQRQQRELMAFMSQNKVNPFKGCLPILPQIPVFIAFYNLLSQTIELRHAPFFGWITDLASRDPYYITPILLAVGMFLQQKLTPNPGMDKNQEKIMLMMPVIFGLMMLSMPAGMVLYMITNTIVSIVQQQWLNKRLAKQLG